MKIFFTIYFWLIISQFANFILAQSKELEVQEKPAGKILQIMDEKSALILIYSELDLTFPNYDRIKTAPIEINKVSSPYTYKLLVTAEYKTIQLRVSAKGFIPKTIEINDLSPKKTVVLNIFEKSVLNLSKGEFHLTTEPGGAKITIDGQPTFEKFTPYTFTNWTARAYKVTIYKENYYVHIDTIIIDKDKANSLNVKLRAKFGILVLSTDPANKVLIDGKSYDHKNPVQIPEGNHYILVKRKYFKDYVDSIYIVGQYEPMMIENEIELEPYMGTIAVTSKPSGAEVYLNENKIGITPLSKVVNAGYYNLELKKDDYRKEAMTFEILKDESVNKLVELKKTSILIIVGIINTKITLNGENSEYKGLLGNNRKIEFELPAGEYIIRAELVGFDTEEFSFELTSEVKTIDISLTEMDKKFLRWTGFGNSRISSILNGFSFTAGYLQAPLTITFANQMLDFKDTGWAFDIGLFFAPFSIGGGYCVGGGPADFLETLDDLAFESTYIYGNIGWSPFVLWETIYPAIGLAYNNSSYDWIVDDESIFEISNGYWAWCYELTIRFGSSTKKTGGGLIFKFSYQDPFDKSKGYYSNFWAISGGFWFGMNN